MYSLICQKPAHFLSAQMALMSTFFQMLIELGMYNFDSTENTAERKIAQLKLTTNPNR